MLIRNPSTPGVSVSKSVNRLSIIDCHRLMSAPLAIALTGLARGFAVPGSTGHRATQTLIGSLLCCPSAAPVIGRPYWPYRKYLIYLAPRAGFEPATNRLTAGCSTAELPGKSLLA